MLTFLQFITEKAIKYDVPRKPRRTGDPVQDKHNELQHIEKLRSIEMKKLAANVPDNEKRIEKQRELEFKTKMLKHNKRLI